MPNFDLRGNFDRRLDFDNEDQLVRYIRNNLMTRELYVILHYHNITIRDLLNGRLPSRLSDQYNIFFDAWNTILGRREFGF